MISFKEFLTERIITPWEIEHPDVGEAISILNKNCKSGLAAIASGSLLYRGFKRLKSGESGFTIIDTANAERTSKDTNNLYQLMMDTSSAFRCYPSRSNSLICSTDVYTASVYGDTYVIFPFDGTLLAVSKQSDFIEQLMLNPLSNDKLSLGRFSKALHSFLFRLKVRPSADQKFTSASIIDSQLANIPKEKILKAWDYFFFFTYKSQKEQFDALISKRGDLVIIL